MAASKIHTMKFSRVYPLLVQKAERKARTKDEVDAVIFWLTGLDAAGLEGVLEREINYQELFAEAPCINANAEKITGVVCGVRVENIEDPVDKFARQLDKLVDELAKGKPMEKVLRQ